MCIYVCVCKCIYVCICKYLLTYIRMNNVYAHIVNTIGLYHIICRSAPPNMYAYMSCTWLANTILYLVSKHHIICMHIQVVLS